MRCSLFRIILIASIIGLSQLSSAENHSRSARDSSNVEHKVIKQDGMLFAVHTLEGQQLPGEDDEYDDEDDELYDDDEDEEDIEPTTEIGPDVIIPKDDDLFPEDCKVLFKMTKAYETRKIIELEHRRSRSYNIFSGNYAITVFLSFIVIRFLM